MAVTEQSIGTVTVDGSVQTITSITDAGNYQFRISLVNLVNGEAVLLQAKVKPCSAGAAEIIYNIPYKHAVGSISIVDFPWIAQPASGSMAYQITRTEGTTAAAFVWSVLTQ